MVWQTMTGGSAYEHSTTGEHSLHRHSALRLAYRRASGGEWRWAVRYQAQHESKGLPWKLSNHANFWHAVWVTTDGEQGFNWRFGL